MRSAIVVFIFVTLTFASNPWHKNNLYDNITMSYYIPYELWLQTPWDGEKNRDFQEVNSKQIKGPFNWYHPYLKRHLNVYKRSSNQSSELYTLYPKGIAKVYDSQKDAFLNSGLDFPGGFGWKIGTIYNFSQEIWIRDKHRVRQIGIEIKDLYFKDEIFQALEYNLYIDGKLYKSESIQPIMKK